MMLLGLLAMPAGAGHERPPYIPPSVVGKKPGTQYQLTAIVD